MENVNVRKREEIAKEDMWAIEDLYEKDELWQQDYEQVLSLAEKIRKYQGRLSESSQMLMDFMADYENMSKLSEKVYVYANQRLHENTANSIYQELSAKAQSMLVATGEA